MMRAASILFIIMVAGTAHAAVRRSHPYREDWKHSTYGKHALIGVTAGASVAQLRHRPRQFGGGAAGFGKRLGAGFATHAVKTTVEHAVAAPLHEDLHYHRSTKRGFGPRMRHALVSTVITSNTRTGKHTAAVGRISGNAAAGAVSQALLPAASGASTAGIGLAADAGSNVAREFWPRHHHHVKRRA
jgi:hypothetical protein